MNLNELRAYARKLQKNANAKVNRLNRKGVIIAGTEFDVRRDASVIGRYNTVTLQRYVAQLEDFTSRNRGFVAGAQGAPLPIQRVRYLQLLERKQNEIAKRDYDRVKGIKTPSGDRTIGERDEQTRPPRRFKTQGEPVHRIFDFVKTDPSTIANINALDKFIRRRKEMNAGDYKQSRVAKQRQGVRKMMTTGGMSRALDKVDELTDEQFYVWWNFTNAHEDLIPDYDMMKRLSNGESLLDFESVYLEGSDERQDKVIADLDWASSLSNQETETLSRRAQRRRKAR